MDIIFLVTMLYLYTSIEPMDGMKQNIYTVANGDAELTIARRAQPEELGWKRNLNSYMSITNSPAGGEGALESDHGFQRNAHGKN